MNNAPGYTWSYTIYLQRLVNGEWSTTDTLLGSFANNVTRSFNITDNFPGDYRVYGKLSAGGAAKYNKTDSFKIYR
ncbi:hypothetical protein [Bacillus gaemokensis]|uniref:hypothetical protein n=1 Tax=Bacillus gaemokensis TaxID=574375 RepID=UPI0006918591|nr:hypothetical protein [Bacillus gaemokensis]KYG34546.1 hypothetical protein AZF08_09110 [Bacillus gaemokensis]